LPSLRSSLAHTSLNHILRRQLPAKALESALEAFQGLLELAVKQTVTRIIGGALGYEWLKRHGMEVATGK
jgi:hypothetical protein